MNKLEQVIANLTLSDALEYQSITDKWCFVQDSFAGPNGLKNSCVEAIEDALDAILAAQK